MKKTSTLFYVAGWIGVLVLAVALRFWNLGGVPAGLHQDEAWFAYNAFLLKSAGTNIYGDRWPLTVDMWGDHVSSFHSFSIVPFIALFGLQTWAFRLPFVISTLVSMGLASWLLYRWTKNRAVPLFFGLLFATSQWNIIMSRASSTVVLDTLMSLLTITVFYEGLRWVSRQKNWPTWQTGLWWLGSYALTIASYFTYFTSRITLPVFLVATLGLAWYELKLKRIWLWLGIGIIAAYMVFPFGIMLRTPYALGRYQETTIVNSGVVQNQIFLDISRSGQAGIPALVTRMFYNKVSENVRAIAAQYVAFFSPSVVLFQTAPPVRYFVPQTGVINSIEYLGLILALAGLLMAVKPQLNHWRATALAVLLMMAAAILPTALTVDDFPNFQRGVFVTPFWQMAAALGWGLAISQFWSTLPTSQRWQRGGKVALVAAIAGGLLLALAPFTLAYYGQSRYANIFNRSRAGENLGVWMNSAEAHDSVILMDHDEANFVYPYLFAGENVLGIGLESPEKYVLKAPWFRIGQRHYVHHLCQVKDLDQLIANLDPQFILIKKYPPYDDCVLPPYYELDHTFTFDDKTVGYEEYRVNPILKAAWDSMSPAQRAATTATSSGKLSN